MFRFTASLAAGFLYSLIDPDLVADLGNHAESIVVFLLVFFITQTIREVEREAELDDKLAALAQREDEPSKDEALRDVQFYLQELMRQPYHQGLRYIGSLPNANCYLRNRICLLYTSPSPRDS